MRKLFAVAAVVTGLCALGRLRPLRGAAGDDSPNFGESVDELRRDLDGLHQRLDSLDASTQAALTLTDIHPDLQAMVCKLADALDTLTNTPDAPREPQPQISGLQEATVRLAAAVEELGKVGDDGTPYVLRDLIEKLVSALDGVAESIRLPADPGQSKVHAEVTQLVNQRFLISAAAATAVAAAVGITVSKVSEARQPGDLVAPCLLSLFLTALLAALYVQSMRLRYFMRVLTTHLYPDCQWEKEWYRYRLLYRRTPQHDIDAHALLFFVLPVASGAMPLLSAALRRVEHLSWVYVSTPASWDLWTAFAAAVCLCGYVRASSLADETSTETRLRNRWAEVRKLDEKCEDPETLPRNDDPPEQSPDRLRATGWALACIVAPALYLRVVQGTLGGPREEGFLPSAAFLAGVGLGMRLHLPSATLAEARRIWWAAPLCLVVLAVVYMLGRFFGPTGQLMEPFGVRWLGLLLALTVHAAICGWMVGAASTTQIELPSSAARQQIGTLGATRLVGCLLLVLAGGLSLPWATACIGGTQAQRSEWPFLLAAVGGLSSLLVSLATRDRWPTRTAHTWPVWAMLLIVGALVCVTAAPFLPKAVPLFLPDLGTALWSAAFAFSAVCTVMLVTDLSIHVRKGRLAICKVTPYDPKDTTPMANVKVCWRRKNEATWHVMDTGLDGATLCVDRDDCVLQVSNESDSPERAKVARKRVVIEAHPNGVTLDETREADGKVIITVTVINGTSKTLTSRPLADGAVALTWVTVKDSKTERKGDLTASRSRTGDHGIQLTVNVAEGQFGVEGGCGLDLGDNSIEFKQERSKTIHLLGDEDLCVQFSNLDHHSADLISVKAGDGLTVLSSLGHRTG